MDNSRVSTTRVVVAIACGVLALAALLVAAFVYKETPEPQRHGEVAVLLALSAVLFASAFLVVVAGTSAVAFLVAIVRKLS